LNDDRQILPRPTPVAMATKFGTKSAITRLVQEISLRALRLSWGYRGRAIEWCQSNFKTTDPGCHGNEIWDDTGYNSARIKNIAVSLAHSRGYSWVGHWMMSYKFYHDQPRCHGTKFKAKSPITRPIWEISWRSLLITGGFRKRAYWMTPDKFYCDQPPLPRQRNLGQNRLLLGLYMR